LVPSSNIVLLTKRGRLLPKTADRLVLVHVAVPVTGSLFCQPFSTLKPVPEPVTSSNEVPEKVVVLPVLKLKLSGPA
jgi:hypothetical protein